MLLMMAGFAGFATQYIYQSIITIVPVLEKAGMAF